MLHLAFAHEMCPRCQVSGRVIRHASSVARSSRSLCVPVIHPPLIGFPVFLPRSCPRPIQPLCAAQIAAVRMPPIAASVNIKVSAATAAVDLVNFRLDLGETKTRLLGTMPRSCPYPLGGIECTGGCGGLKSAPSNFVLATKSLSLSCIYFPVFGIQGL